MISVVVGILRKEDKVLIAQRGKGKYQEYKWEFPGGKIEEKEIEEEALIREFNEEFGINVKVESFLCENIFQYPEIGFKLRAYIISTKDENLNLRVHENLKWVNIENILDFDFLAGDVAIAKELMKLNS